VVVDNMIVDGSGIAAGDSAAVAFGTSSNAGQAYWPLWNFLPKAPIQPSLLMSCAQSNL
jgi:hypothetical protein